MSREWVQRIGFCFLALVTAAIVLPILLVVGYVVWQGAPAISCEFLTQMPRSGMREGGVWPAIVGTLWLTAGTAVFAVPLGVAMAVYLAEYASDNLFTRLVRLSIINLAGIPSVVYGLFGLGLFVLFLKFGSSILAGSLTLAIMTLPVIIVSTKEALAAVPMAFRVACWNLGATRWQTIRTIVLPNSVSGMLTGLILEVCRAAGETAPIMFTGAVFFKAIDAGAWFPYHPSEQCMALSYHLHTVSTQVPGVPEPMLYGTAVVLVGFVLAFNSVAIALRVYLRSRKRW